MYTVDEVAEKLRVSPATVRTLIRQGELKAIRVGGQLRVRREDLEEYIRTHQA
jgi:excisionase family DNA binding protein